MLQRLLEQMDEKLPEARKVFVGDYVDRGDHSAAVLNCLQDLQAEDPQTVCLIGNHEEMLLQFLETPHASGPRWLRYGGLQTLASYSVRAASESASAEDWANCRDRLAEAMGSTTIAWLQSLPTLWQSGNVAVLHAAAAPSMPISAQERKTLIWGHEAFDTTPRSDGIWIVHGHTIVDEAIAREGRISVDTGAYASGRLTAALLTPGAEVSFLRT